MSDDIAYIKRLENDVERDNKIFSNIGDVVDDAIYYTSVTSLRVALLKIGKLIGLNMPSIDEIKSEDGYDYEDDDLDPEDFDD